MKGVRVLVSIPQKDIDKIDDIVKSINKARQWYHQMANRQAVIKAFIRHCLEQEGLVLRGRGKWLRTETIE
ncbi:MAG: hypothetical protein E3J82_05740 [Candidatus Thorarchaeota archaeon]|nr:MAG: hypothetical protein E3J82_05740 [Candidatus Thorarchaeota archaeon]